MLVVELSEVPVYVVAMPIPAVKVVVMVALIEVKVAPRGQETTGNGLRFDAECQSRCSKHCILLYMCEIKQAGGSQTVTLTLKTETKIF